MIALQIEDVRGFMAKLLTEPTFDGFGLHSIVIDTFARFEIYGKGSRWGELRGHLLAVIKGRQPPKSIKAVLSRDVDEADAADIAAQYLNLCFDGDGVTVTTGIQKRAFTMDKALDERWDAWVLDYLKDSGVRVVS